MHSKISFPTGPLTLNLTIVVHRGQRPSTLRLFFWDLAIVLLFRLPIMTLSYFYCFINLVKNFVKFAAFWINYIHVFIYIDFKTIIHCFVARITLLENIRTWSSVIENIIVQHVYWSEIIIENIDIILTYCYSCNMQASFIYYLRLINKSKTAKAIKRDIHHNSIISKFHSIEISINIIN